MLVGLRHRLVSSTAAPAPPPHGGENESGRALARAPVGGGLPASPFRLRDGFTVPPLATFPAALPKIPYVEFPPVRLQAPGTSQFGVEPSQPGQPLKPYPGIPGHPRRFTPPFGAAYVVDLLRPNVRKSDLSNLTWAQGSSLQPGYVVPAILTSRPLPPV